MSAHPACSSACPLPVLLCWWGAHNSVPPSPCPKWALEEENNTVTYPSPWLPRGRGKAWILWLLKTSLGVGSGCPHSTSKHKISQRPHCWLEWESLRSVQGLPCLRGQQTGSVGESHCLSDSCTTFYPLRKSEMMPPVCYTGGWVGGRNVWTRPQTASVQSGVSIT